jgi:hypothetical protein
MDGKSLYNTTVSQFSKSELITFLQETKYVFKNCDKERTRKRTLDHSWVSLVIIKVRAEMQELETIVKSYFTMKMWLSLIRINAGDVLMLQPEGEGEIGTYVCTVLQKSAMAWCMWHTRVPYFRPRL